jgi:glycine/D-amino acid oxidase-like deaminating enzyme
MIFENTPMTRLVRSPKPAVKTPGGKISAEKIVLAMNAWSTQLPELRRGIFVITSDDAISAPVGDDIDLLGWRNGPIITNSNTFVSGYRTTRDGRVVAGVTGGAIPYGRLARQRFDGPSPRIGDIGGAFSLGFGADARIPFVQSWRGPIDRTRTGLPAFGRLGGHPDILFGYGFSGNGIVGCRLGSRILRSLVLEWDDEWSRCGLVRRAVPWMPPEPFRFIGAHLVRGAIRQQDRFDHEDRNQGPIARALAGLAPGGIVTTKMSKKTTGSEMAR